MSATELPRDRAARAPAPLPPMVTAPTSGTARTGSAGRPTGCTTFQATCQAKTCHGNWTTPSCARARKGD